MKKKLFFAAIALTTLAGCTDESYVGDQSLLDVKESGAITFGTGIKAVTRAEKSGSDAATLLNNNFVFMGTKGTTPVEVFPNYQANFINGSSHSTESNSSDWEYVGFKNVPGGVTTNVGVNTFANLTESGQANADAVEQSIKYWDYATTQYDFAAYSLGTGTGATPTYATSTAITTSPSPLSYTITGSPDELKACYISDLVTKYNTGSVSDFGTPVQFKFRSMAAKIRLAFYETVPGYSVKDVEFYADASSASSQDDPTLFASSTVLPSGNGTITVTFPNTGWDKSPNGDAGTQSKDYNKAHVTFEAAGGSANLSSTLVLEDLASFADKEYREEAGSYLGRTSSTATFAGGKDGDPAVGKYFSILPYETGANLTLRIKYTLVSRDGTGEEITVNNASAVIPAELAKWSPNYAYTYIFKIGDMTNGSTGVDASTGKVVTGLTPITLDAVVVDDEDGIQETITTVSTPSITTYSAGKVITANDEYKKDKTIYIIVNNGTSNVALTVTDALLYTAEIESGAAQGITEETVKNAIAANTDGYDFGTVLETNTNLDGYWTYNSGTNTYAACASDGKADGTTKYYKPLASGSYSVRDANGKKLVVKGTDLLSLTNQIPAVDSPTGNNVEIGTEKVAKFTPTTAGYYAFQYTKPMVPAVPAVYAAVANDATYSSETTYYTFDGTNYTAYSGEALDFSSTGTTYYTRSDGPEPYTYTKVSGSLTQGSTYYNWTGSAWNEHTADENETSGTSYYTMTPAVPAKDAINQFKVIKVVN